MKIALVSGSPRSGTSAMMRLLGESGVPLFFLEESRPRDENNPLGYFENPLARQTIYISQNTDEYINAIQGKLSKLAMSKYIINLPTEHTYYIIWMERDPMESAISLSKLKENPFSIDKTAYLINQDRNMALLYMNMNKNNFNILKVPMKNLSDYISIAKKHISPAIEF
jgi:hypothetical protein